MNFNPDFSDPLTYAGGNPEAETEAALEAAMKKSYDELLARHTADYQELFGRVSLDLGGAAEKRAASSSHGAQSLDTRAGWPGTGPGKGFRS